MVLDYGDGETIDMGLYQWLSFQFLPPEQENARADFGEKPTAKLSYVNPVLRWTAATELKLCAYLRRSL
jgi:hypothetical protein